MSHRFRRAARSVSLVAGALALLAPAAASASPYSDAVIGHTPYTYLRFTADASAASGLLSNSGVRQAGYPYATMPAAVAGAVNAGGPYLNQPGALTGDADPGVRIDGVGYPEGLGAAPLYVPSEVRYLNLWAYTFEAWVKPGRVDARTRRIIASDERAGGTLLAARSDGVVFSRYLNPGDYTMVSPKPGPLHVASTMWSTLTAPLPSGRYSHVVATYQLDSIAGVPTGQGNMSLYVNSRLAASRRSDFVPALPAVLSPPQLAVGATKTGWMRYDGLLDELATYRWALSTWYIAEHYRIGTTGA